MKLSFKWLNTLIEEKNLSPETIAAKLTMGAFEVEDIHKVGSKLKGPIVIGRILDIQSHPNADRLSVTKVTTDSKNELQIVCGAKNIKIGQLIPVSLEGAVVINRNDGSELVIKKAKIRDVESNGMLCSPGELGIQSEESSGIFILPEEAPIGADIIDYLALEQDDVLEVGSRSNRGDALSVYGLAKEVSALTGAKIKEIKFKEPDFDSSVKTINPEIENTKDTTVFFTSTIEDIEVKESPGWLKSLLNSAGIRSINNIVDITNYISFTFGQPMHAYDREKLNGGTLLSRNSKSKERITTLDDKTRELKEGVLVIADNSGPVALAGIMGGKDSEVTENTKNIVFEAAVFSPFKVRKGSRSAGLSTEASKRFERGVDPNFTYKALLKAIELTEQLASPKDKKIKCGKISFTGSQNRPEIRLEVEMKEIKRVLGLELKAQKVIDLLQPLDFDSKIISDEKIEVNVPQRRLGDISRPIDIIEEVARLYGYDRIPAEPPKSTNSVKNYSFSKEIEKIKDFFISTGFSEAYISSLVGLETKTNHDFIFNSEEAISMLNPLSVDHAILRQSLLPGLLECLKLNQSHKIETIKVFEVGKVYFYNNFKQTNERETGITENLKIAGIFCEKDETWFNKLNDFHSSKEYIFFKLKGVIESLTKNLKVEFNYEQCSESFLHPNISLKISLNNKDIGRLGYLHPSIEKKHKLLGPIGVFEIELDSLLKDMSKPVIFQKISSQPPVERDITIDLNKNCPASSVLLEIKRVVSKNITNITLVNNFELDKETRSLTYRLKLQDLEQTLTGKQIEDEVNNIKNHLSACLHAKFRV